MVVLVRFRGRPGEFDRLSFDFDAEVACLLILRMIFERHLHLQIVLVSLLLWPLTLFVNCRCGSGVMREVLCILQALFP